MSVTVFRNARVVDVEKGGVGAPEDVVVRNGKIERGWSETGAAKTDVLDAKGNFLLPGLIDCHVHVIAGIVNLAQNALLPDSLVAMRAVGTLKAMISRGFTTVRDAGGADYGLVLAVDNGLVPGPRLFIAGRALSQTGGHGDLRGRFDSRSPCLCHQSLGSLGRVVDGVDACRLAVREEIKAGANQIKVMASGGIASPTDPIDFMGFSVAELTAIVEEARNHRTYVMAHAYTAEAIGRAIECGVRTIEHGNLIDQPTAEKMAKLGAYAIPTLSTYEALATEGEQLGLPAESVAKIGAVREAGLASLSIFKKAGVKMAYATDLLGDMHRHQSNEFEIRARVLSPLEVLQAATVTAAEVIQREGQLGVVKDGAIGDLLLVERNPLEDISVLSGQGENIPVIMKEGRFFKREWAH